MQAVAEHMNEMQKIYDEYGAVFDALSSDGALHCRVGFYVNIVLLILLNVMAVSQWLRKHSIVFVTTRLLHCISQHVYGFNRRLH